jgi:hypothetical protein
MKLLELLAMDIGDVLTILAGILLGTLIAIAVIL